MAAKDNEMPEATYKPQVQATRAEELEKAEASRDRAQAKSRALRGVVQQYLRNHGQFRATTVTNQTGVQSGHEFVPCECGICQEALALVETPTYE